MKRILLFFLLLIAIVVNKSMIFAIEDQGKFIDKNEKETLQMKKDISDLLNKRANLWNSLFTEETNIKEINEELKELVAEPLLTYDIEAFEEIKNKHTGMEKILNVDILKLRHIKSSEDRIVVHIEVEWLMEGFEKNYKERVDYIMDLIKDNNKWKISDYKVE